MKDGQDNSAAVATEWKLFNPLGEIVAIEQTAIKALARINGYKPTVETLLAYEEQGWRIAPTPPNEDELTEAIKLLRRLKSDLENVRRFQPDTLATYRRGCSNAEGDIEEFLANYRARKGEQG